MVEHIRRFGPAILFATEAFESFNAVIRAKSVHSNRQAPSRDIALAFAQGNRIRHLLSGGLFRTPPTSRGPGTSLEIWATSQSMWRTIGQGPIALMSVSSTATSYLGLVIRTKTAKSSPGLNLSFSRCNCAHIYYLKVTVIMTKTHLVVFRKPLPVKKSPPLNHPKITHHHFIKQTTISISRMGTCAKSDNMSSCGRKLFRLKPSLLRLLRLFRRLGPTVLRHNSQMACSLKFGIRRELPQNTKCLN